VKLIDLLVRELPKHGGWPDGVKGIEQNPCGCLLNCVLPRQPFLFDGEMFDMCDDWKTTVVTREQYEAAIAATQRAVWNGEGLPTVGCECEALFDSGSSQWCRAKIIGHDDGRVVGRWIEGPKAYEILDYSSPHGAFRPIRSEADKKRDEAIQSMASVIDYRNGCSANPLAGWLYDAIAAGKIPHIQLK